MKNNDVKIFYADEDIKKIQLKPNMYIQKFGSLGIFHLAKEAIQNSFDEQESVKGNFNVFVSYDHKTDKLHVEDDGRGIPEEDYPIDIVCTGIQSGSKFFRENGKSSGEFGVGLVVCNALSSYFKLATYRNTYVHIIEFENGEKVNDIKRPIKKGEKKHGTVTEFISNPRFMGQESMPFDVLMEWLEEMSYQISPKIKLTIDEYNGLEKIKSHKIKVKEFKDLIYTMVKKESTLYDPITLSSKGTIKETIDESIMDKNSNVKIKKKEINKDIFLEVTFVHEEMQDNHDYRSYCNFTRTDEGGVHIDSVEEVICRYFQTKTRESMTENEKNKWEIKWEDVKRGLSIAVNLSTNAQVDFMGNAKNRIQNEKLKPILKSMIQEQITAYFDKNQSKLSIITREIKMNARARIESQKIRSATKAGKLDRFKELEISNYRGCNNTGNQYKELIIVEGERSATSAIADGRDPDTQAIFGFRGVTLNPLKYSVSEVMQNKEWRNFVNILKTGFGKDFDIKKLFFDKIILMTDADVDGYYISEGIVLFIAYLMPEIIEEGHLYKCFPPLYHIEDGKNELFLNSKSDLTDYFMKKVSKSYKIYLDEDTPIGKDELFEFLFDTMNYYKTLVDFQKYFSVDKLFIERLANFIIVNDIHKATNLDKYLTSQNFITKIMTYLQKEYPEISMPNKGIIRGIVGGRKKISIRLNERNLKKISLLEEVLKNYPYELFVESKKTGIKEKMTICEFMELTHPLRAKIIDRFKGLGEGNGDQIGRTCLDPENRVLVRITMDDVDKAMKVFNKLNGKKKKDLEERKAMIEAYRIDREDLDN